MTSPDPPPQESEQIASMARMAHDPQIQAVCASIQREFTMTEADGLETPSRGNPA